MEVVIRASWGERFWAWLIDVLLVGIAWIGLASAWEIDVSSPLGFGCFSAMLFIYWTALEGYRGQSLGKMVQNIVVVGAEGERIGLKDSAVESLGKAFLLPIDCLIGWAAFRGQGQRAFNRLSNTIVASAEIAFESPKP
ncbi:MAG: RDD family protein [Methanothrix sp.]